MQVEAAPGDETQRDANDLRRSMRLTLWSYILRIGTPFLLIVVVRLYGAGPFGVFAVVTGILGLVMRASMLGLDKGLLWWLPRQGPGQQRAGIGAVLLLVTLTSSLSAVVISFALAPWIAAWAERPDAVTTLRWMAASVVPMALMEVFIHACAARRRPDAQILIKDGTLPILSAALAIAFYFAGMGAVGLGLAHTVTMGVGAAASAWLFGRVYAGTHWSGPRLLPHRALMRVARPLWLAELLATTLNRLDVYMLAALSDPVTAGFYQGALQIVGNITAVRTSFDSLVTVLVAETQVRGDMTRLVHGFSHALGLIALVVVPLTAFIFAFAGWILPLLGEGFVAGVPAVWIMSAFFLVHGTLGMNQQILIGSGRGAWVPIHNVIAMLSGAAAYVLLLPRLGLTGAGLASGLTYFVLSLLYVVQARLIVGTWPYDRQAAAMLGLTTLSALVMVVLWFGLLGPLGDAARVAGFLGFLVVFTPGAFRLRRAAVATPAPPVP